MFAEIIERPDSPEFIARCQTCKMRECNCEGDESMQTCIMRNGADFEFASYRVQHRYKPRTSSIKPKDDPHKYNYSHTTQMLSNRRNAILTEAHQ